METHLNKAKWILDPSHSEVLFKVRHLMISNVKGEFRKFSVEVDGNDFRQDHIKVQIQTESVFTNDDNRDTHLRSADFFDSANHPEIHFESSKITKISEEDYTLSGMLTIKGISREIDLNLTFNGTKKDPWGNEKAGFSVNGNINRNDWGLTWNAALEAGGLLVSEMVQLSADIQLVHQA